MRTPARSLRELWVLFGLFVFCILAKGCACEKDPRAVVPPAAAICVMQNELVPDTPPLVNTTIVPGTLHASYSVDTSGQFALTIPLDVAAGRGAPALQLAYDGTNAEEGPAGVGFSVTGVEAVTRCPKTVAMDGETRAVQLDADDAYCVFGKRLVVAKKEGNVVYYVTWPDAQINVVQRLKSPTDTSFEAFLPDGSRIQFGTSAATRPKGPGGVPRAWLAAERVNPRGLVETSYGYCFASANDVTVEYALREVRYSMAEGNDTTTRVVKLAYRTREHAETWYWGGMPVQSSLELQEIQSFGPNRELALRYPMEMAPSETTGQSLLHAVQECTGAGECTPPLTFMYAQPKTGFADATTTIDALLSTKASPILADFDGDGIADYWVGDSTELSTPANPITEWRWSKSTGSGFGAPKVALLQDWSFQQDPEVLADPTLLQPELGTVLPYLAEARMGLLLHDVYGNRNNNIVLVSKDDGTFEVIDTGIQRPFPLGPAPKQLRNAGGAVHLAAVTPNGMPSLVQCEDHGSSPEGDPSQSHWTLHLWKPEGFDINGTNIETLAGIPCGTEVLLVDVDHNSTVELVVPGVEKIGGHANAPTTTYVAHHRRSNGKWEAFNTLLPTPLGNGRTLFADVNGDGLPDAVQSGSSDLQLHTYLNTGKGFSKEPQQSVPWDGLTSQQTYFHLAQSIDFDSDGKMDALMPLLDVDHPDVPRWVILRATGGSNGHLFETIESGIPFEPVLGDAVTLADPRGPRVGDWNGDGSADVAIFLGNRLHVFQNRAADVDVLVGLVDGMNDHDPDEPGFVPTVEVSYTHLTDAAKTKGEAPKEEDVYTQHEDVANACTYPRHCAVGSRRVVKEYRTNDGQGGQRRYGLRYRDGRYDHELQQWLGFGRRLLTDLDTGATVVDMFDNVTKTEVGAREVYPFAGQVVSQWQWSPGLPTQPDPSQVEMAFAERTIDVVPTYEGASYFTLPTNTHTRRMQGTYAGAGSLESWVMGVAQNGNATMLRDATVKVLDYDEFHNVLEVDVSTAGTDATMHIARTVRNDVDKWLIGLPDTQTECSTGAGLTACRTIKRTTNAFGEVETETTSSSDKRDDSKLFVTYEHDAWGNVTKVLADDAFSNHREARTEYDAAGVFPTKQINGLGHETVVEYDGVLGALRKETDPNGLITESKHDGFGRLTLETRPDGSRTTITRTREKVDGVWRTKERTTTTGGADDEVVLDSLGRTIATFTHGPEPKANTARIMQRIEYDRLSGKVAKKSVPIAEGTSDAQLLFDEYAYDAVGREVEHVTPWNHAITTLYLGNAIEVTEPGRPPTRTELDALGRIVRVVDAKQGITRTAYGPFNTLRSVTDPGNATTTWTRDAFGRVIQLDEPDRGTTTSVYSGFGDLLTSTDALGRTVTWTLDALGRATTRTDTHAGKTLTTTSTWDTAPHGIGELHKLTSPDAMKTYSYTKRGQLHGMTLSVGNASFATSVVYDDVGRAKTTRYPQPLGEEPFEVTRDYDAHGHVVAVRDAATQTAYWQLTDVDAAGRYAQETFGNGVTTTRAYHADRSTLKSITTMLGGSTIQQLSYEWTERLNLKSRTDARQALNKTEWFRTDELDRVTCAYFAAAENPAAACATSYGYAANGNLLSKSDVGAYSYLDPKHPHAVTNVPGASYSYDAVGNQITRPGGTSITYTPFDLPKTITQGAQVSSFGYDGDQRRIRKTTPTSEWLYVGDLFEQVSTGAVKEFRYYVSSPERVIAVVTRGGNDPGTRWLHTDHLGSVESVTDATGKVVEKRSYDVFGAKRNPQWGQPGGGVPGKTTRGYTGHKEDDEFGLVNMKGRLYDPKLARFTTTDPVIASVFDGQSLSPYSYVRNNQLALVDPSGFDAEPPPILPIMEREWTAANGEIIVDLLYPPREGQQQKLLPPLDGATTIGAVVPPVDVSPTGNGGGQTSAEGVSSFFQGLLMGSLADNDSISATIGGIVGGLIPGVGLAADIRDLGAAVKHVAEGKQGAWLELGASVIGFVPGGDIAKSIAKGATKATTKGAAKVASEAVQEIGKVAKGSTAAAADAASGAQKAVKGAQVSPRGPPAAATDLVSETGSYTTMHASGKVYHGKGPRTRSQQSGRRIGTTDEHIATDWTPAKNSTEAFKDEARRLKADGGPNPTRNYNQIESPGKKFIENEDK